MRRPLVCGTALLLASTSAALAHHSEFTPPPPFAMGRGIGGVRAADPQPASLAASRIAALPDGALAIDEDSGELLRTDRDGAKRAELAIGAGAGLLVYDAAAHTAYVADRRGDRIAVVSVADDSGAPALTLRASWRTPTEPYAVALSPDRKTLLVATVAARMLVALDTATGDARWQAALGPEPRGLAIAPDGSRALVTYLAIGGTDEIDLATHRALRTPFLFAEHARAAYAALFLGARVAVVPFQHVSPAPPDDSPDGENPEHYGGSFESPPLDEIVEFFAPGDRGRRSRGFTRVHQPRALAWDGARDALYIAGIGNDEIVQVARASQVDPAQGFSYTMPTTAARATAITGRCGADGLATAPDGALYVWCAFTRSVSRLDTLDRKGRLAAAPTSAARGPELVASTLAPARHDGLVLFHTADANISQFAGLACASCHLDGRADGESWRIHEQDLQTPMLAGRLVGTAPFKWDGTAPDLASSVRATVTRLGGNGLSKAHVAALVAYLEGMPAVRTPPPRDAAAVARGQALFESDLGCTACHDGPAYTDRARHDFHGAKKIDTPSLVGLAASAPYFHDGSAATLEAVLRERGAVHGMADAARALGDAETSDLVAYLQTL